jgi:hypothetical protein
MTKEHYPGMEARTTEHFYGRGEAWKENTNFFDPKVYERFGWVPHGEIQQWCRRQYRINANNKKDMTEELFWNMILYTKNKGQHAYQTKYWPKLRTVMIKANTEENTLRVEEEKNNSEELQRMIQKGVQTIQDNKGERMKTKEMTTPKKGWAAPGFEGLTDSDNEEDMEKKRQERNIKWS